VNPWRWVDPRVRLVRVANIQAYLLGRGWKTGPAPNAKTLLLEAPTADGDEPVRLAMPSSEEFSDYPSLVAELITTLSEIEDRHPVDVLNDILGQGANTAPPKETTRRKRQNRPA
jgi:hypothetical protein